MVTALVLHFTDAGRVPPLSNEVLSDLRASFNEALKPYPGVDFKTFIDENGMGVCIWEALDIYADKIIDIINEVEEKVIGAAPADPVIVVRQVL